MTLSSMNTGENPINVYLVEIVARKFERILICNTNYVDETFHFSIFDFYAA